MDFEGHWNTVSAVALRLSLTDPAGKATKDLGHDCQGRQGTSFFRGTESSASDRGFVVRDLPKVAQSLRAARVS